MTKTELRGLVEAPYYPGMDKAHGDITRAWLLKHGSDYDRAEFNLRLGEGMATGVTLEEAWRRMAVMNSQKRIDMVLWRGDATTIVEVKRYLEMRAVGQLIGYRALWQSTFPESPAPTLLAVGERLDTDVAHIFRDQGIEVEVIKPLPWAAAGASPAERQAAT